MNNEIKTYIFRIASELDCSTASLAYNPMERFADYVSTKEIVHSKIIADLLNPNGEHQLGNCFLINLLKSIGIDVPCSLFPESANTIKLPVLIETEKYAPTTLDGVDTKGRIDIFLLVELADNKKYAVIIENKLNNAPDQDRQLERYNTYIHSQYRNYEIRTVYMPRIRKNCDHKGAYVIDATELACLIEKSISESNSHNKDVIQAYAHYLKNISKNNKIMDNARILSEMSGEDILKAKAIKDAYSKLCAAFAECLKKAYEGRDGLKVSIPPKYDAKYCYIWNQKAYGKTSLWLAVGFDYDGCFFYIVSNNTNNPEYSEYLKTLNITKSSEDAEGCWHRPNNENLFKKIFTGRPDYKELESDIDMWLKKLDEVAGIK